MRRYVSAAPFEPVDPASYRLEGFQGQRLRVIPASAVAAGKGDLITEWLAVTDIGYFPTATAHRCRRDTGSPQTVVIVCTQGLGYCQLPSARVDVGAGQVLAIPPGTPHEYGASDHAPWTIWWAHVTGAGVPALIEAAGFNDQPVVDVRNVLSIASLMDEALRYLESDDSQPSMIAASGAMTHALALVGAERRLDTSTSVEDSVLAVVDYLRAHSVTHVSRTELAHLVGLSESYLATLFHKATGMSILQYQTQQRMTLARELLDTTSLPIGTVAHTAGYADPLYFSRQFRRLNGMSPETYRSRAH